MRLSRAARNALSLLCSMIALGCQDAETLATMQTIAFHIGKPIRQSTITWPDANGKPLDSYSINQPCNVALHFKNGHIYSTHSLTTHLHQEDGVISHIVLAPLRQLVAFNEALGAVRDIGAQLGIESQSAFADRITEWSQNPPSINDPETYSLRARVDGSAEMFLEMKPHASQRGYLISLTFYSEEFLSIE